MTKIARGRRAPVKKGKNGVSDDETLTADGEQNFQQLIEGLENAAADLGIDRTLDVRREELKRYLRQPHHSYDHLGRLHDHERPGLETIHSFVRAVALEDQIDDEVAIALAEALALFLNTSEVRKQQATFAKELRLIKRAGRPTPGQGKPIKEVAAARMVLDLINQGAIREQAIGQVAEQLFPKVLATSRDRSVERWYDLHKKWVRFVYSTRDEYLEIRGDLGPAGRNVRDSLFHYIELLEGAYRSRR